MAINLAHSLANLPPGTSIVTADGTPIVLDGTQQLVIHTGIDESSVGSGKESSAEGQLRSFWHRQMERIRAMRAVSSPGFPVLGERMATVLTGK